MGFPKDFIWGAASASYQIEGAVSEDGRGESIWDVFSHTPGKVKWGDTGDTAADAYHRWRDDIAIMKEMGLQAYRFSIAWPRVDPKGDGHWNQAGLHYYSELVDGLLEEGIQPWVTLFHWDLPQALQRQGGWQNPETARRFEAYAEKMAELFRGRVRRWFTFNEPQCFIGMGYGTGEHAPGLKLDDDSLSACWETFCQAHSLADDFPFLVNTAAELRVRSRNQFIWNMVALFFQYSVKCQLGYFIQNLMFNFDYILISIHTVLSFFI